MNRILVVEIPDEQHESFVKFLPPGSTLWFDHYTGESDEGVGDRTRWFDKESSSSWNTPQFEEYNWLFLRQQQNWANDLLRARGYLFLNDVYGTIGLSLTRAGAILGWVYDEETVKVDFGCWGEQKSDDGRIKLIFNATPIFHRLDV